MTSGHPELVAAIASEISRVGAIPFARFMELALYHPQFAVITGIIEFRASQRAEQVLPSKSAVADSAAK